MSEARKKRGFEPEEVALKMGIGLRMYNRYEYGETMPSTKRLQQFAEIVGVPVTAFLSDKVYELSEHGATPLQLVPVLNRIPAGGFVLGFDDVPVEEHIYSEVKEPNVFALRVVGDSMSPKIDDGDLVVVSPERPFEDGKIYCVIIDGDEHTLKTVKRSNGGYLLIPYNQMHEMLIVPDAKMVKLYRVLEIIKRV
jgi:SOS-response transcriptional repressor LexA